MRDILAWALTTEIVGLAALPALRAFFGNRRDAALLSRPVGLALAAYFGWALSMLTQVGFTRGSLLLGVAAVGAVSLAARRGMPAELAARPFWGSEESRAALSFWGCAAVFLLIRAAAPEILGAEKFMDLAFFNSLSRFPSMPPIDPWMAGKTINYYYWGYLLAAALAKISGVAPLVAYNLALANFAAYSFVAAACLALRLSRGRLAAGLAAGFGTVFAGNLAGAFDAWSAPFDKDFNYWNASRVIGAGNTINEFPFFTFFHADLHPHLLAFPFFLCAFVAAHRLLEAGPAGAGEGQKRFAGFVRGAAPFLLVAFLAGTAIAANLWNAPALGLLLVAAGVLRPERGLAFPPLKRAAVGTLFGVALFLVAQLLLRPYTVTFKLPYSGVAKTETTSGLIEFLGMWGILFAVAGAALLALETRASEEEQRRVRGFLFSAVAAAALLLALWRKTPALLVILFLGFLAARAGWRALRGPERDSGLVFSALLVLLSLGMIGGCEAVYLRDSYGRDLQRMNTLFKFYHQAWPLLAIGSAVFAERAWHNAGGRRVLVRALFAAAAFLALLYPVNAAVSRLRQKEGPFSLDARRPLARRNAADAAAIGWLLKNAPRGSVVMEATGDPYSEFSRVSSHTGIPTVLGWANHEGLWRSNAPEVNERARMIYAFYASPNLGLQQAYGILQRYGVTHVVVGGLERQTYPAAARVGAYPFLQPVVTGETTVYRMFGAR